MVGTKQFVMVLALTIACALPETAMAQQQKVRAGAWDLVLPIKMPRREILNARDFKKEIDGPFHTLIFSVFLSEAFDWEEPFKRAHPAEKKRRAAEHLYDALRSMKQGIAAGDERNTLVSIEEIPVTALPINSFCGGYRWQATDRGVPEHKGKAFTMLGYSVACIDYVENADEFDFVYLGFSQRFCSEMGHTPLPNFHRLARELLSTIRYRKGPGHKAARDLQIEKELELTKFPPAALVEQINIFLRNDPVVCSG